MSKIQNAGLNVLGEPNSTDPERQALSKQPIGFQPPNTRAAATLAAPIQGSEAGDAFNRSLNATQATVQGGSARSVGEKPLTILERHFADLLSADQAELQRQRERAEGHKQPIGAIQRTPNNSGTGMG